MSEPIEIPTQRWDALKPHFFPHLGEMLLFESFPFIAYALDSEGNFLWYNAKCRESLRLPEVLGKKISILDFYNTPRDRERFLNQLHEKPSGEWLENSVLDFKINGKHQYLRDYSRWVEGAQETKLGVVSIMINATEEERYHQLLERLPIGIFRFLEEGNGLDYANDRFLRMHGYGSLEEVRNAPVSQFVVDREKARRMIGEVRENGTLEENCVKHVRKDKKMFWGSINAVAIRDDQGKYFGTEGTVMDVSAEGLYGDIIHSAPIGLYKVEINAQGEHIIVHCNDTFARNLYFDSHKDLIGKDIRQFHGTPAEFDAFYSKMLQKEAESGKDEPEIVVRRDRFGKKREYQVYPFIERDSSNQIVGRIGAQRDVTRERELQRRLDEMRGDIGRVLHAYSTTLVMAKTNFDAVLQALAGKEHFDRGNQFQEKIALEKIDQSVRSVQSIANRLRQDWAAESPEDPALAEAMRLVGLLHEVSKLDTVNLFTAQNHEVATRMNALLSDDDFFRKQPKERIRPLRQAIDELTRHTSVIFLHRGLEGVLEMETPVVNLRSFIMDGARAQEAKSRVDIYDMMLDIIKSLFSYAASKGIEIKYQLREIQNAYLFGHELELRRAFTNILHNAIKYSWTRKSGSTPYIDLRAQRDATWLTITFENRGVGISRKEIEEGRVWELGYRGEKSSDRGRPGTGIGLYDSKKIIEESHQGSLEIESRPVFGSAETDNPNQPYITTVICRIPLNPS
jgi:PAS domain S-box-containing protein